MPVRAAGLLAILLLAVSSCARPEAHRPPTPPQSGEATHEVCRVGPDGGPLLSDRGIGGTGAAFKVPPAVADRGIGGTGAAFAPSNWADRGIGGTGIIGVITGFASVCL
ncbi:MAG: hypothetical protein JOZ17_01325, partial [Acetobacteraceae bacterium]|nr:hypothetical protein [Acetobacteraceae bacterium]